MFAKPRKTVTGIIYAMKLAAVGALGAVPVPVVGAWSAVEVVVADAVKPENGLFRRKTT